MRETLEIALKAAGWTSGTYRGYRMTRRAGIEFEVGEARGGQGRLVLLYRYRTDASRAEGEVDLPEDAQLDRILDAMTEVYLRVHEKPDPTRVFGGGRRRAVGRPGNSTTPPPPDVVPEDQGSLDF